MSFSFKRVGSKIIIDEGSTHIPARAFAGGWNQAARRFVRLNDTEVVIPDSVKSIGKRAFWFNNLTSVSIPDSVTSIGHMAFAQNRLKRVDLSNSLKYLPFSTFDHNRIVTVSGGDSLRRIGNRGFYFNRLKQIDFPSLRELGHQAFGKNRFRNVEIPSVKRINLEPSGGRSIFTAPVGHCTRQFRTYGAFEGNRISKAFLHPAIENARQALGSQHFDDNGCNIINPTITHASRDIFGTITNDKINGNYWSDNIFGDSGDDIINGGGGNDLIKGQKGNDILRGDGGNDSLYGSKGDDKLIGGSGDDLLDCGDGDNILFGGDGRDIFDISGYGDNTIKDLNLDEGDRIALKNVDNFAFIDAGDHSVINYNDNASIKVYGSSPRDVLISIDFE